MTTAAAETTTTASISHGVIICGQLPCAPMFTGEVVRNVLQHTLAQRSSFFVNILLNGRELIEWHLYEIKSTSVHHQLVEYSSLQIA